MRLIAAVLVAALACCAPALQAQTAPPPQITVVMPTGAKAGTTVELTVTGQDLDNVEGLHFSFPGAKIEVLSAEKAPVDMKKKGGGGGKMAAKALNQKFKVAIPANAPLGFHDLRVVTKGGVSNPRAFVVGDLNEITEKESNNDVPEAQKIDLGTTVSGVISTPTDVDYFQFTGKKGQRVVAACMTSSIDSKLPALLQIYSSDGKYLGFSRNYWNNDAVADAVLPEDGDYFVRLCSFTYTLGGQDYFYRLTISTAPWVDAVFPPIVEAGKETTVTVFGRNLPGGTTDPQAIIDDRPLEKATLAIKAPGEPLAGQRLAFRGFVAPTSGFIDGFEHRLKNQTGVSNPVLIGLASAPIVIDNEANDLPEKAQPAPVPCAIVGRIEKKGDRDCYRFSAKKGQALGIELFADRIGSAMDMQFALYNEKGDKLTDQDDTAETLAPQFFNRTDDPPHYRFTAPADGAYTLVVTSKEAYVSFGPRFIYTVRVAPEVPDFRVIAMPMSRYQTDSLTLGQAGHQALTVLVQRSGGFTGDITLTGDKLPPGVTIRPQVVAGNQKLAAIVVSAAPKAPTYTGPINIVAVATANGKKLTREVRGASITWSLAQQQQNTPTVSRLDRELVAAVRDKAPYILSPDKTQFAVPQGDRISIPLKLTAVDFKGGVQVSALTLPTGMAMQPVTAQTGQNATINLDSKTTVLPGNYTVILQGQTQAPKQNQQPKPGGPRNLIQTSPPIFVTIVPKQLAKLTAPNNAKIKIGGTADVTIKVARQFEYSGVFKVEVDTKAAKGVTATASPVKSDENEVTLKLTADDGLRPGSNATITVRVTAMFNDAVPVVHETKFTLAVTK